MIKKLNNMQTKSLQMKWALRTTLLVLLLDMAGLTNALAQSFTVDDLNYTLNGSGATVTGHAYGTSATGILKIPARVSYNGTIYPVTQISENAFSGCTFNGLNIDMIDIPSGGIDEYNNHLNLFHYIGGCFTGPLTIGNSVVSIGDYAFYGCAEYPFHECAIFTDSLTIGNSVTTIGEGAFMGCSDFTGNLNIPNSVTTIGILAFAGCSGFTGNLTIPNSVTEIGYDAFGSCSGFTSLVIPNSVTTIGNLTFNQCSGFTNLTIPNSVTTIGSAAFYGCSSLTSIWIPNSVTLMESNSFQLCSGLEQIVVESGNPVYDSRENCNAIIETATNTLISGCQNTIIPNSVSIIGNYAFQGCTGFTGSLTIPNSVTTIGEMAFRDCTGFTGSLTIPNSVTTIGNYAFLGCNGFTGSLTIGNSATEIGYFAFAGCSGFTSITSLATTPPYLISGSDTFEDIPCTTLTIPCNCIPAYESSDWATYFSSIVEDCSSHSISIDNTNFNGNVSSSVNSTNLGEEVILTITPNEGMVLASLVVCNANDPSQTIPVYPISIGSYTYGFLMPPYDVVVKAVFVEGTAVGESNSIAVLGYPNPTQGQMKIEAEDLKQISISNMLGQVIYEGKAVGNEFTYNLSQQGEGIYLVRIETASGVITKRMVVTQ